MKTDAGWTLKEARKHLDEVISDALEHGPQTIVVDGRRVVVVAATDYPTQGTPPEAESDPGRHIVDLLNESPLKGLNIEFDRDSDPVREVDLGDSK